MFLSEEDERFEIRARLGSGSFGVVYEAFDRYRNRAVALKVLERASADAVARFKREFRTLAEVRHPNLASLYELLVVGDRWVLSMELIKGVELLEHLAVAELQHSFVKLRMSDVDQTLRLRRLKKKSQLSALYIEHVRDTFRQLAVAIAMLHSHGIVHRDIKPSNIMITPEGRVVLLDFGLAVGVALDDSIDRKTVVGTPGYMSPEQIAASKPSMASDWYGFGVLLFQALSGKMPFTAPTQLDLMQLQLHGEPARAVDLIEKLPRDLATLADACISRDPAARPADHEVLRRLGMRRWNPGRIDRKRPRRASLIGRSRDLRALRACVDSSPGMILLHGSAGSGKSALLDLLLDQIRAESDALILSGCCQAWESVSFNAIDSLVDSLARELRREHPPQVDAIMGRAVAVTQLFPALIPMKPSQMDDETVAMPAKGKRLISRAISELRSILRATAGKRPLLIVLDDAQWGDYQSAEVMLELLREPNLTILLSYRSEDWRTSLLLQALVGAGVASREFHLRELSPAMTAQFLKSVTGRDRKRLAQAVFRQTKGNPAMIEMTLEALRSGAREQGALLTRAIALRLRRLSAPAQQLFQFLLSRDGPINDALAAKALELFESDEPLRTLRHERLIRVRKTGDLQEIDVYHPTLREALDAGQQRVVSAILGRWPKTIATARTAAR